ncbi:MAG: hypothetical protein ACJ786_10315, partial [Catenulispora sp.]
MAEGVLGDDQLLPLGRGQRVRGDPVQVLAERRRRGQELRTLPHRVGSGIRHAPDRVERISGLPAVDVGDAEFGPERVASQRSGLGDLLVRPVLRDDVDDGEADHDEQQQRNDAEGAGAPAADPHRTPRLHIPVFLRCDSGRRSGHAGHTGIGGASRVGSR